MIVSDFDRMVLKQAYQLHGRAKLVELISKYGARNLKGVGEESEAAFRAELMTLAGMPINAAVERTKSAFEALISSVWKALR